MNQPRQTHSCSASAFRALALLDGYEQRVREITVVHARARPGRRVAVDLQALVCCCAELPELAVPFMELMLSHQHLIEAPASDDRPDRGRRRARALRRHMDRIRLLHRSCSRYLCRNSQH